MKRFPSFTFIAASLSLAAFASSAAVGQSSPIQQLKGSYLGVAKPADLDSSLAVQLSIDQQLSRHFTGTLSYVEQDNLFVRTLPYIEQDVLGTITRSGWCAMIAQAGNATLALALDWQVFGGGAAALTGEIIDGSGPIALLRPFDELGVKWANGSAQATFRSELFDISFDSTITMSNASLGHFNASFSIGREQFEVIGTSSASEVLIVGVSGSQIITISGQVQTDARTGAMSINGSYQIQTAAGKPTDSGIIAILIG